MLVFQLASNGGFQLYFRLPATRLFFLSQLGQFGPTVKTLLAAVENKH